MARKIPRRDAGTVVVLEHDSKILADNPLGDPSLRKLAVWLPREYDLRAGSGPGRRFPVLVDMVGFTGSGLAHLNWKPFSENVGERAARLVREGKMGPAIIVFPDCFTALGGNQYVNSSAIGNYADYLLQEIVPTVDREFRTLASREHRGCFGKSSGGYGAIIHGMKYARHWGAIADHSGDAYFDFVYRADWPNTLNELAKYRRPARKAGPLASARTDGGRARARRRTRRRPSAALPRRPVEEAQAVGRRSQRDHERVHGRHLRPRSARAARLPAALPPRQRRLDREPLAQLARARPGAAGEAPRARPAQARRHLHRLWLARPVPHPLRLPATVAANSRAARIAHRYEEFDDDHSDVDYRMDVSLPFLYRALKP